MDTTRTPLSMSRWIAARARAGRELRRFGLYSVLALSWRIAVPAFFVVMTTAAIARMVHLRRWRHAKQPRRRRTLRRLGGATRIAGVELGLALVGLAMSSTLGINLVHVDLKAVAGISAVFVLIWGVCIAHNWAIERSRALTSQEVV